MRHFLFGWTNSIGSSMVMMCSAARLVDQIDDRGQRRRLARAGRAGDEHEAAADRGDAPHLIGQAELLDGHDLRRDDAEDRAAAALLAEEVDAVARHARDLVREVDVAGLHELVPERSAA